MSNIFNRLELQAFRAGITPRTKESRAWFKKKASNLRSINREALMKEEPLRRTNKEVVGNMYMFQYDPKYRQTLPYYDAFPLVIITGARPGGFIGMNLHYLPAMLRAKLLDAILGNTGDQYPQLIKNTDGTYKLKYGSEDAEVLQLQNALILNNKLYSS